MLQNFFSSVREKPNPFEKVEGEVNGNQLEFTNDVLFFKKGQTIYYQGSSPQGIFIIKSGKVKISRNACNGKEFIVKIASKRDIFGHICLLNNIRYTASAEALEDTSVIFVHKRMFLDALKKREEIFEVFINQLCIYILNFEQKATDMAYKPVRGRLAQALLTLDNQFNGSCDDEDELHHLFISRGDLAGLIGTVKETVNRLLSEFRNEGIIVTDGTEISILDGTRLQEISSLYD